MSQPNRAWVIGHISVRDSAKWDRYRAGVPATLVPFDGSVLLRGGVTDVLAGAYRHTDAVVLAFPDVDRARAWHASEAYQKLIPLRREAADVDLVIVGG